MEWGHSQEGESLMNHLVKLLSVICLSVSIQAAHAEEGDVSSGSPLKVESLHRMPLQQYRSLRLQQHLKEQAEQKKRVLRSDVSVEEDRPTKYEAVVTYMEQLHAQYSETTELFDLGLNDDNVMIKGIKIGSGSLNNLVVATHHGNEYGSTEVAKAFAASMAKEPLADQTIYVIPVLNINGYNRNSRNETAKGVSYDANRDYPGPCVSKNTHALNSTRLLAQFVDQKNIVSSMTLHTYFPAITYPWGVSSSTTKTDDHTFFQELVKLAATGNNYYLGTSTDVVYPADGTFEDYAYWKHGVWSLLYEIGTTHSPSPTAIEKVIRETLPGMRLVFKNSQLERSKNHDFKGNCNARILSFDPHME